jgi:hypothetical protein
MMQKIEYGLGFDDGALPESGTDHTLLLWVDVIDDPSAPQRHVATILEGTGEWAKMIEVYEPTFLNMPDVMVGGLYAMLVRLSYEVDAFGDEDDVTLVVTRHQRLGIPTREDLRVYPWARAGVSA